jgi:hypothetical protein
VKNVVGENHAEKVLEAVTKNRSRFFGGRFKRKEKNEERKEKLITKVCDRNRRAREDEATYI